MAAVLAAHLAVLRAASWRHSATYDEPLAVSGGVSWWATGDHRVQPTIGPAVQLWGTLPLLVGDRPTPPPVKDGWTNYTRVGEDYAKEFLYQSGRDGPALLRRCRLAAALWGAALCLVVFGWARQTYGAAAGWAALLLAAACPAVLANAELFTGDVPAATCFALVVWRWQRLLEEVTPARLALSLLAVMLAAGVKHSAPLLIPLVGLVAVLFLDRDDAYRWRWGGRSGEWRGAGRRLTAAAVLGAAHALAAAAALWAWFGFRYAAAGPMLPPGDFPEPWAAVLADPGPAGRAIDFCRTWRLLPEAYLYGVAHHLAHAKGRWTFFFGEVSDRGAALFFPYCLWAKTPLALQLMLLLAAVRGAAAGGAGALRRWRPGGVAAAALAAGYLVLAIRSGLNIGHRHLLPMVPALLVLASGAAVGKGWWRAAAAALVGWQLVTAALFFPHYLAYFQPLAGGPRDAYRRLADSSLDWGQDLPALRDELGRVPPGAAVYADPFGATEPAAYGVAARPLMPHKRPGTPPLEPGWVFISATRLGWFHGLGWDAAAERRYRELRRAAPAARPAEWDVLLLRRLAGHLWQREPVRRAGYTILGYPLTAADVAAVLDGPVPE